MIFLYIDAKIGHLKSFPLWIRSIIRGLCVSGICPVNRYFLLSTFPFLRTKSWTMARPCKPSVSLILKLSLCSSCSRWRAGKNKAENCRGWGTIKIIYIYCLFGNLRFLFVYWIAGYYWMFNLVDAHMVYYVGHGRVVHVCVHFTLKWDIMEWFVMKNRLRVLTRKVGDVFWFHRSSVPLSWIELNYFWWLGCFSWHNDRVDEGYNWGFPRTSFGGWSVENVNKI